MADFSPGFTGPVDRASLILVAIVCIAMTFGAVGTPVPTAVTQLGAALLVALWIAGRAAARPLPRSLLLIAALLVAVPLLQLVPLPPLLWTALPGRGTEIAALSLIDAQDSWRPLAMAAPLTVQSLLAMTLAAALLLITASAGHLAQTWALRAIALVGLVAVAIGIAQFTGGMDSPLRFHRADGAYMNGFQSNHNHAALLFMIAMLANGAAVRLFAAAHSGLVRWRYLFGYVAVTSMLFAIATVFTGSRAGIALLPLAVLGLVLVLGPFLSLTRRHWIAIGAGVAVMLALMLAIRATPAAQRVSARFDFAGETRPELWSQSLAVAARHFPAGGGMGTFAPLFVAEEPIGSVDETRPVHVHNDYLELLIEAGLAGPLVLAAITALLMARAVRRFRAAGIGNSPKQVFAVAALLLLALHSLVDYPLRSVSLACLAAIAVGLLASRSEAELR